MREKKYTPGPWVAVENGFKNRRVNNNDGSVTLTYDAGDDNNRVDCEANAHLIAAAPELLEALEQLSEWVYQSDSFDRISIVDMQKIEAIDKLQASAIAKAYGEKS